MKELDLSEGKSTGIPTIQQELRNNGSPKARFFTDEDRCAVTVEIPIHQDFLSKEVDIEEEKVDIENLKKKYYLKMKKLKATILTISKVERLLSELGVESIFGRAEVVEILDISPTAATNLLSKMREAGVIVAVKGKGKGKYKFWNQE